MWISLVGLSSAGKDVDLCLDRSTQESEPPKSFYVALRPPPDASLSFGIMTSPLKPAPARRRALFQSCGAALILSPNGVSVPNGTGACRSLVVLFSVQSEFE